MAAGLQAGAKLRGCAPHTPADRADPAVSTRKQTDDPVSLTELVHSQHDRFVSIQRHPSMLSLRADRHRLRRNWPASQLPVQHNGGHAESQAASDSHEEGRPGAMRVGDASD